MIHSNLLPLNNTSKKYKRKEHINNNKNTKCHSNNNKYNNSKIHISNYGKCGRGSTEENIQEEDEDDNDSAECSIFDNSMNYVDRSFEITSDIDVDHDFVTLENMPTMLHSNVVEDRVETSTSSIWYDLLLELPNLTSYRFKFPSLNILNNHGNRARHFKNVSVDEIWNKYTGLSPNNLSSRDINRGEGKGEGKKKRFSDVNTEQKKPHIEGEREYDYGNGAYNDIFENNAVLSLQNKRHMKRSRKFKKRSKFNLATFKLRQLWFKGKVPILTNEYLDKPVIRFGVFKGVMDQRHDDCPYSKVSNHKHKRQNCLCQTWTYQSSPLRNAID